MKSLKFSDSNAIKLILGKKITNTWRINDDDMIRKGDLLSLCDKNGKEFARAKTTSVRSTIFGDMAPEDKKSRRLIFKSDEEMYMTFSKYYKIDVSDKTKLKIICFELEKRNSYA